MFGANYFFVDVNNSHFHRNKVAFNFQLNSFCELETAITGVIGFVHESMWQILIWNQLQNDLNKLLATKCATHLSMKPIAYLTTIECTFHIVLQTQGDVLDAAGFVHTKK